MITYNRNTYKLITEDKAQLVKVMTKFAISKSDANFKLIKTGLKTLPALVPLFLGWMYKDDIQHLSIRILMKKLSDNKFIIPKLPKDILKYNQFKDLKADVNTTFLDHDMKKLYRSFPKSTIKIIDNLENSEKAAIKNKIIELKNTKPSLYNLLNMYTHKLLPLDTYGEIFNFFHDLTLYDTNWNKKFYAKLAKGTGDVKIINKTTNSLLIRIDSFEAAQQLQCNTMWCTAIDQIHWDANVPEGFTMFQFHDFSKESIDPESMIAIITDSKGSVVDARTRNDKDFKNANRRTGMSMKSFEMAAKEIRYY